MTDKPYLILNKKDNLAVALEDISPNEEFIIKSQQIITLETIYQKHKFALQNFKPNDKMILYGVTVGIAAKPIAKGSLISTQNTLHKSEPIKPWKQVPPTWQKKNTSKFCDKTFLGYHRADGQVGTANNWIVIPLVFCENNNLLTLRDVFNKQLGFYNNDKYENYLKQLCSLYKKGANLETISKLEFSHHNNQRENKLFTNVDGLKFLFHDMGCGGTKQDSDTLCQLLANYIHHPNTAGATVLSLGCQKAQIALLQKKLDKLNFDKSKPLYFVEQQNLGTQKTIAKAIKKTFTGLIQANKNTRSKNPLSKLIIGVECGASDGFSGISANPNIGECSDLIISLGGTSVLAEFPELFGVEQEIINRCRNQKIAQRFIQLMSNYEKTALRLGSSMASNPSPGNIRDGLITDAIKSAGAAKKGGTSHINDVLDYPDYVTKKGLNLLCTPGNDVESTTALVGAGCNLILFSTGSGTPTGNPIAPVIKISSNTQLIQKLPEMIDFDSGKIITGKISLQEAGEQLLQLCIEIASGKKQCKANILNQDDFIPWKRGVSL